MTDYILSAELSLKDRFTAKISKATSKTHDFINKMKAFDNRFKKVENKMNNFAKKVNQTTNTADKLKNKLDDTQKRLDNFGATPKLRDFQKDMDKALEKIDQTKVKFSNLGNPLKNFEKGISKSVNLMNNVASKMWKFTKWGVIGGAGLGVGALKVGADFETLKARMVTAFKGDEKKATDYYKWANEFANQTPYSNDEVIDATAKLQAYGYDPKRMMTMIGDWAAGNGKTLDQAVEAYADASRKEFERLKEFNITKDEVLNYAKETLGDPVPMKGQEITNMDKFMKALDKLMKERTKDGMKNLAKTLNGMLSTTKGLLKSSVGKMVGVTEEGHIRAGSLMDRVKEKFERFNTYMQSPEGQKAVDRWSEGFVEAIPKIIKIADSIKEKFKEIAGENFMEKLNNSIKKFDPKSFNEALDNIKERMDIITERAMRVGGFFAGMQLAKVNPYLGVLAMGAGAFSPEIIEAVKKSMEYDEHRKQLVEKAEKNKEKVPIRISGATEETNKYLDDYFNGKPKNTGVEWLFKADKVKGKIENVKTENQILNDYARENVIINNNNDNRVFNTTNNNYTENKNHSESNNNSKVITNNEDLSNVYNTSTETIEGETKKAETSKVFIDNRANINITVPAGTDKVALNDLSKDIISKIEEITNKRIDKTFENMTTEFEFA